MSPDEIQHFLIIFDRVGRETKVHRFGTDYDAAQEGYAKAEQDDLDSKLDIVLISADSLKTIEQTHSSYFQHGKAELVELLPS